MDINKIDKLLQYALLTAGREDDPFDILIHFVEKTAD